MIDGCLLMVMALLGVFGVDGEASVKGGEASGSTVAITVLLKSHVNIVQ